MTLHWKTRFHVQTALPTMFLPAQYRSSSYERSYKTSEEHDDGRCYAANHIEGVGGITPVQPTAVGSIYVCMQPRIASRSSMRTNQQAQHLRHRTILVTKDLCDR